MQEENQKLIRMIDHVISTCVARANSTHHSSEVKQWGDATLIWLEARKKAYQFLGEENVTMPK